MKKLGLVLIIVFLLLLAFYFVKKDYNQVTQLEEVVTTMRPPQNIDWKLLGRLDYKTGEAPQEVKDINGRNIRLPGFIVPLSDNNIELHEFLLVPDPQSCVHVPPPPPNYIVHVKLAKPIPMSEVANPSWVTGVIKIEKTENAYGSASYAIAGKNVEKYNP